MITFGFVALCFVLLAIALAFAFLYVRRVFEDQRAADKREFNAMLAKIEERLTGAEDANTAMVETIKLLAPKDAKNAFTVPNYKESMNQRYVDAAARIVTVNGEQVPVGKTG